MLKIIGEKKKLIEHKVKWLSLQKNFCPSFFKLKSFEMKRIHFYNKKMMNNALEYELQKVLNFKKWSHALSIVEKIEESGMEISEASYNSIIGACIFGKNYNLATKYIKEALSKGIMINESTIFSLIGFSRNSDDLQLREDLFFIFEELKKIKREEAKKMEQEATAPLVLLFCIPFFTNLSSTSF